MAPTPPNLNNLTAPGAAALPDGLQQPHRPEHAAHHFGGHHVPPYPGAAPAPAPAPAAGGVHHARPQQHAERDAYPDTYPGQYEFAVNPPVHRKPPPPVPPYPGTEHLYNTYPSEAVVVKEGGMPPGGLAVPPGPGGPPVGPSGPGGAGGAAIVVRAEEALLVLLVLVLWVAAIALFFNRWGKIRMLEPYQPKFQQHRQSCALVDISGTTQVKSAMDLQTLVLSEHEPALGPLGPIGATTSASVLPTCSPSMRRASHVPVGSVPLGAIRHHASFSHASFSEHQPSCSYHRFELRAPGGLPSGLASIPGPSTSGEQHRAERLTSMDRYSHGSNV